MSTQQSHSSYWLDRQTINALQMVRIYPSYKTSPEYIMRLSGVRRAIANFVRIVAGRDIPVHFSTGKKSFAATNKADEEVIVISATDDPDLFDANVGTALHEAAHMLLSKI